MVSGSDCRSLKAIIDNRWAIFVFHRRLARDPLTASGQGSGRHSFQCSRGRDPQSRTRSLSCKMTVPGSNLLSPVVDSRQSATVVVTESLTAHTRAGVALTLTLLKGSSSLQFSLNLGARTM